MRPDNTVIPNSRVTRLACGNAGSACSARIIAAFVSCCFPSQVEAPFSEEKHIISRASAVGGLHAKIFMILAVSG